MNRIDLDFIRGFVKTELSPAVGDEYARKISEMDEFIEAVRKDVETSSAWFTEGHFNTDDLRLAIGRTIFEELKILECLRK